MDQDRYHAAWLAPLIVVVVVLLLILLAMSAVAARGSPRTSIHGGGRKTDRAKAALLEYLRNAAAVRLAPSKRSGVGVLAIRDIPKGADPFTVPDGARAQHTLIDLSAAEVAGLPPPVRAMVTDFIHPDEHGRYAVPKQGLAHMDMSFYLNEDAQDPNIDLVDDPQSEYVEFRTNRAIPAGEELTIRYADYDGPPRSAL